MSANTNYTGRQGIGRDNVACHEEGGKMGIEHATACPSMSGQPLHYPNRYNLYYAMHNTCSGVLYNEPVIADTGVRLRVPRHKRP